MKRAMSPVRYSRFWAAFRLRRPRHAPARSVISSACKVPDRLRPYERAADGTSAPLREKTIHRIPAGAVLPAVLATAAFAAGPASTTSTPATPPATTTTPAPTPPASLKCTAPEVAKQVKDKDGKM